jgi:hypothetical protein
MSPVGASDGAFCLRRLSGFASYRESARSFAMDWLPTIHPVAVVVMTLGFLVGASLMLAVIDLKFVSQRNTIELTMPEIRERTHAARPRRKDGGLKPGVPLAIARVIAFAAAS